MKRLNMQVMAIVFSNPLIYKVSGGLGRALLKYFPFVINNRFNPWYKQREMPTVPNQSFRGWFRQNRHTND